jgi:cyclohexa-1,5-dienecarbonyl-CoA hydratase
MNTHSTSIAGGVALERTHGGAVAQLELRNGKGNILTAELMRELRYTLAGLAHDKSIKVIVISGSGDHFSFGASVEEHTREHAEEMLREFHGLILDVAKSDLPVVSCVTGMCLGGALELALSGHVIFADASAHFGQPEITLGVFAPPASVLLPLRLGFARAEELLLTGESITAERAAEIGLVNKVFATREALREGAEEWIVRHILPKSASSLRIAIYAERLPLVSALQTTLPRLARLYSEELMATHDANEGIQAFLERRAPVWTDE